MAILLGIDLGTSSVKAMLTDSEDSDFRAVKSVMYDVSIPAKGMAEQSPETWYLSLCQALEALREKEPRAFNDIAAIGLSGQMHGLVAVSKEGRALRPAIIWLDQRARTQMDEIYQRIDFDKMRAVLKNRVSAGFAFPSLLWLRDMEPETYSRIDKVMLPKDYIRLRLTGEAATDVSDASSTTLFDIEKRDWAWDIADMFDLRRDMFPKASESTGIAGYVTKEASDETGLRAGIPVVFGAGDQPCYSLGIGVVKQGALSSSIGTSGQLAAFSDSALCDGKLRTQTFCHAVNRGYTIYGATLCAGMSLNWLRHKIIHAQSYAKMDEMAARVPSGAGGLIYLPYLTGERTPHMNPDCRGMFLGLALGMDDGYLVRAVMEGVVYSLRDCMSIMNAMGLDCDTVIAAGSGAVSGLWLQMQADILGRAIKTCYGSERAATGACMLAGLGIGAYSSVDDATSQAVKYTEKIYEPDNSKRDVYNEGYERYKKAYVDNFAAR